MAQSKDSVLLQMRSAALSKHVYDDFPALLAVLASADYWSKREDNPFFCKIFCQIVFEPSHYGLSFERLAEICGYSEKTLRTYCKKFTERFLKFYEHFCALPLPFLVSRYIEFFTDRELCVLLAPYRMPDTEGLAVLIADRPAPQADKDLALLILRHFQQDTLQKAG